MDTTPSATRHKSYSGDLKLVGKEAEAIVLRWLQASPNVLGVTDLSDIEAVQHTDADFLLKFRGGGHALAEVKSDRHMHWDGNLVFEMARIYHVAKPENSMQLGWSAATVARWLIVYSPNEKAVYVFPVERVREVMQRYTREHRGQLLLDRVRFVPTDYTKSTLILLIPLAEFRGVYRRYDVSKFAEEPCS